MARIYHLPKQAGCELPKLLDLELTKGRIPNLFGDKNRTRTST